MISMEKRNSRDEFVLIIMATYNGEEFLPLQLASLEAQTHLHWRLYASDDGSTDNTVDILNRFAERIGIDRVTVVAGPRKGFAKNFLAALESAPPSAFYAFSDQDDIWLPEKLASALAFLNEVSPGKPALYCGRTILADEAANMIGKSPLFRREASFANALVQSIGGGNTMVINAAARHAIVSCSEGVDVISHDWWAYQVVTGVGGVVYYDRNPQIYYRQHSSNLMGNNRAWRERIKRGITLLSGGFREWTQRNIDHLSRSEGFLTQENRNKLRKFRDGRDGSFFQRLILIRETGVYRQTLWGQAALFFAIILRKI